MLHCVGKIFKSGNVDMLLDTLVISSENEQNLKDSYSYIWQRNHFEKYKLGFPISNAVKIKENYLITDNENKLWLYDETLTLIENFNPELSTNLDGGLIQNINSYYLLMSKGRIANKVYYVFDMEQKKDVFQSNLLIRGLSNLFIVKDKYESETQNIKVYDLDANLLWSQDLIEFGNFKVFRHHDIGGNYLLLTNDNKSLFFNLITGELLWQSEDYLLKQAKSNYNGDKLIAFNQGYVEYDLRTGQRKIEQDVRQRYDDFGRGGSPYFWDSKNIIITIPGRRNKIYFYDIEKDEMIYIHEEKDAKPYLTAKPIIFHEGHLFVKDFNDTLFVYKLEEGLANKLERNKTHI